MDDLSQFESLPTNLAQLLIRAFYWVDEGLQKGLKSKGWPNITRAQSMIFVNIGEGITRPSEIANRLGVTRQAVHQTLNELSELGLLEMVPDKTDRRAKKVELTEKGMDLGRDAIYTLQEVEKILASRLGWNQVAEMRAALEADWGEPRDPEQG